MTAEDAIFGLYMFGAIGVAMWILEMLLEMWSDGSA